MIFISIFSYCISIFDNDLFRYLLNIPVHLVASTTHLPTFCENYTNVSKAYWTDNSNECYTLFTNIIHLHTIYIFLFFVLICCCFSFIQDIILKLINKNERRPANATAAPNNAAIKARETRLKNTFNEKYSSLLNRLLRALERTRLSIPVQNLIQPFQEEYEDLNNDFEERLRLGQLGRFSSIQNEN
jgi:hypothetical protein